MGKNAVAVTLYHRDDIACPPGAREMMGDQHRVACARGVHCASKDTARTRGGAVRAEYYARVENAGDRKRPLVRYLCTPCAQQLDAASRSHQVASPR